MTEEGSDRDSAFAERIAAFMEDMIAHLEWDLTVDTRESDEGVVYIDLSGGDREIVVQNRAEVLEVFQYLLNRIFGRELATGRLVVDCDGFRARKEAELVEIAHRVAERVLRTGEREELGMMNPYERRIVHMAIAEKEGVRTESAGDGLMKRVVVHPA